MKACHNDQKQRSAIAGQGLARGCHERASMDGFPLLLPGSRRNK